MVCMYGCMYIYMYVCVPDLPLCLVRSGMPILKHWAWISCMQLRAGDVVDGGAMSTKTGEHVCMYCVCVCESKLTVVGEFLASGRHAAHHRAAAHLQIQSSQIGWQRDRSGQVILREGGRALT